MLKEIENIKQKEGGPKRRWFSDSSLDLYVWYGNENEITQFQICYDKGSNERALSWSKETGISHHAIDDGESRAMHMKSTPILIDVKDSDTVRVGIMFEKLAANIEYGVVSFILEHIK